MSSVALDVIRLQKDKNGFYNGKLVIITHQPQNLVDGFYSKYIKRNDDIIDKQLLIDFSFFQKSPDHLSDDIKRVDIRFECLSIVI